MSLVKSTATVGFFTLLSRISGFARDILMANLLGASWLSDAFFVAFKLPNFFRRILAEGAFNAAFIPSFSSILTADGREAAMRFAAEVMSVLLVVLLALNAVFIVFMPWIAPLLAPGFTDDPEKLDLTILLSRICFPYILFIALVSMLGGILNSLNKFAAPAANPILLNLCLIGAMLYLTEYTKTPAHALAIGLFIAGFVQLAWLVMICTRQHALPSLLLPRVTQRVKTMLILFVPAAIGSGVQQINLLVDVIIASSIPDAVSYLFYADRINQLPIGIIGVAVGTVLLPMLSRQIREGNHQAAHHSMNRGIELTLFFGIPATLALLILAQPIIRTIYEHGQFDAADTHATYRALAVFAAGLPAFLMVKIFAPGFFANHDTITPFKIAALCVVINLVLNLILIHPFQHVGMAMATSIASWVNVALMGTILYRRKQFVPDALLKKRLSKMLLCGMVMALGLIGLQLQFGHYYDSSGTIRALTLAGVIGIGGTLYIGLALSIAAVDNSIVKKILRMKS